MILRIILIASTSLVLAFTGPAWSASIGLYSTLDCGSCNISIENGGTATFYVNVFTDPTAPEFHAAIFRVDGLPDGWFAASVAAPGGQLASNVMDPEGGGVVFSGLLSGACINIMRVTLFATTTETDVTLSVQRALPPVFVSADCPVLQRGIELFCVNGGVLFINSSQDCTVVVEQTSWTAIRGLYR